MKTPLFFLLFLGISSTYLSAQDKPVLVTVDWLKQHLNDPQVVVLQTNALKWDYEREHIAGARFLWPESLLPNSPDQGTFNIPDTRTATRILRDLGINKNSHVVLCFVRNEVTVTSRLFLTLEQLGLRGQVSFLNGGLDAWKKAGYAVTKENPSFKKGNFKAVLNDLVVDKDYVLQSLKTPGKVVVDARMKRFYDGEPSGLPRDGHITGALNIPFTDMVDSVNFFKPVEQLQGYFTPVVPDKQKEIVTYCFIGQTASVLYIAGRILGYPMKLYDGSMQEWSRKEELPMEKTKPEEKEPAKQKGRP